MNFEKGKQMQLSKQDKSDKNSFDEKISKLISKINKTNNYYTTSSCSGRIVLIKAKEKKVSGKFLLRTHDEISFTELKQKLNELSIKEKCLIYFKQEPCILHIACKNLYCAISLTKKAVFAGWKKSGILGISENRDRFVVELKSTEKLELPIMNKGRVLFEDEYLKFLTQEANARLERTWEKIKRLEKDF